MIIRAECSDDIDLIDALTLQALAPIAFNDGREPTIIRALRSDGDLSLSLVADIRGQLVAQVSFSPVTINGENLDWFGLGPISVALDHQRRGIGSTLIRESLARIARHGAKGCVVVGDPGFYGRFGFVSDGQLTYAGVPDQYVQRLVILPPDHIGRVEYARGFDAK